MDAAVIDLGGELLVDGSAAVAGRPLVRGDALPADPSRPRFVSSVSPCEPPPLT
jgi:hypothetical protein